MNAPYTRNKYILANRKGRFNAVRSLTGLRRVSYCWVLLISCTLLACDDVDDGAAATEAVIQQKFHDRIAALTTNIRRRCQEEILELAEARADSLLLDRASRRKRIAGRPPRPLRPGEPQPKDLSAPLPLRPLFPFEIRFDSLLRDSLLADSLLQDSLLRGIVPRPDTLPDKR